MARISPFVLIPPVIFAALAGLFASAMYTRDAGQQQLPSALVGQAAPTLPEGTLPGLPALDPAVLADGNVKLVNFFASWCAPCRVEAPQLLALAGEGIPIYGIAYKDDPAKAAGFLQDVGNPYEATGTDPDGRTAVNWGIYGVPETFVVDGDGKVVARLAEPLTEDALQRRLRPALEAAGASAN
ncbi:Cytochrome c-type biogenesis protein CcmG/DsbE, thiol:disulfide oxidoreductase [Rubellimicrobium mesophilum DSM 19309]|uniref:Cytochrome c-type biogenesis protein CcmG/DsbE, thiol:disulfide oxidoreductase n=1 Tax=Rubellimicrobium mesophilum DSM 19309 TaxID=442562 RepID=A0A017HSG2_9RHOB|nr:DsbE family thiol:disulfide interchange protein [Rubellimicrobium mesophilum]EYD77058.1 Cytochrome c-type biogenesis protein CcmG/DsbE, thiol:disulfide oxidoreductase [Rubellimicrobium mesophilum DSM 19309]